MRLMIIAAGLMAMTGLAAAQDSQRSTDIRHCDRMGQNRNACRCALNNGGYITLRNGQPVEWRMDRNWNLCRHNMP